MESAKSTEKYSAPALSKGLDILELLASRSVGMKKSEIAKTLDRSVSEIFRMLMVLTERGYVGIEATTERYSLSLKMFEIAHRHPPIKRLNTVAADVMATLAVELNQSVHMAILNGSDVLVIAQNDPPGNNVTSVRLGARIPVSLTASGAVLASQFSAEQRAEMCQKIETATQQQIEMFESNVEQVASGGVCVSASMVIAGVQNISAPIMDYSGRVIASLTIPFIQRLIATDEPDLATARQTTIAAAQQISSQLGANAVEYADAETT